MLKLPREMKIYFVAILLISLSYVAIYYEMVRAHEVAHQKAFEYFGINSTIVFYSPFEAKTVPQSYNLSSEDTRRGHKISLLYSVSERGF